MYKTSVACLGLLAAIPFSSAQAVGKNSELEWGTVCSSYEQDASSNDYLTDAGKWNELGLGGWIELEVGSSSNATKVSFQQLFLNMLKHTGQYGCPGNCQNFNDLSSNDNCGNPNSTGYSPASAGAVLVLRSVSIWNNFINSLVQAYQSIATVSALEGDKIATTFTGANKQTATALNKLTQGSGIAGIIGAVLGLIPVIGSELSRATSIASGSLSLLNAHSNTTFPLDQAFNEASDVLEQVGQITSAVYTVLSNYQTAVFSQPMNMTAPNGAVLDAQDYAKQNWSIPGTFVEGGFVDAVNDGNVSYTNFEPVGAQFQNSLIINAAWHTAQVYVVKGTSQSLNASGDPCAPNSPIPYVSNANKWCDGNGNFFVIQKWVPEGQGTPGPQDTKGAQPGNPLDGTVPGFNNLTEYNISFSDVIQSSVNNQNGGGTNIDAAIDTLINGIVQPHNWQVFDLPVCDLDIQTDTGIVWGDSPSCKGECFFHMNVQCRCSALPGWPYGKGDVGNGGQSTCLGELAPDAPQNQVAPPGCAGKGLECLGGGS